jgi:hypothetical protein
MLTKVKDLANEALSAFREESRIPIRLGTASPRARPQWHCPKLKVVPDLAEVVVTGTITGASPSNTELFWDESLRTLTVRVTLADGQERSAVLGFTADVDGANGSATLKGETLVARLPRRDVDTFTMLRAWSSLFPDSFVMPLAL